MYGMAEMWFPRVPGYSISLLEIPKRGSTGMKPNVELEPIAMNLSGAVRLLGLSQTKTWSMAKQGQLPSFKVGGRRLFLRLALESCGDKQIQQNSTY